MTYNRHQLVAALPEPEQFHQFIESPQGYVGPDAFPRQVPVQPGRR